MANTLKFGAGKWATSNGTALAYNDENGNFKPLPFTFTRASKATVVNQSGLIEEVSANDPRIDFLGNTKGSILLEPTRTNLVPYSNNLTQWGGYSFSGGSISAEYNFLSPDGSNNATKLTYTNTSAGTGGALLTANLTLVANEVYTFSFWAKNISGQKRIRVDLRNSSSAGVSGTSFELTNEWKKYSHTVTNDNATARGVQLRIIDSEFAGDRTFAIWGMQLEQASYSTSTIPTSGSVVTRVVDACSQTLPDGVIGQTEGTVYAEIDFKSKPEIGSPIVGIVTLNNNVNNLQNAILLGIERQSGGTNRFYPIVQVGNSTVASVIGPTLTDGIYKAAFAYKQNDFVLYVNGSQIGTDNSGAVPTTSQVLVGERFNGDTYKFSDGIKDTKVYNTRLTNAELASLTTI